MEIGRSLLDLLGMYGVRLAVQEIRDNGATTAATLAPRLVEASGLPQLRAVIAEHFLPRARTLQSRGRADRGRCGRVLAHPGRAPGCIRSSSATPSSAAALDRLLLGTSPAAALGVDAGSGPDAMKSAARTAETIYAAFTA